MGRSKHFKKYERVGGGVPAPYNRKSNGRKHPEIKGEHSCSLCYPWMTDEDNNITLPHPDKKLIVRTEQELSDLE